MASPMASSSWICVRLRASSRLAPSSLAPASLVRARQRGIAQIRANEIGAVKPRIGEIGTGEIGAGKICSGKGGEAQIRAAHACGSEIDRTAIHEAHLPLARAQAEAGQVRHGGWILLAPSIPAARSAAQHLDMFSVGRNELQNRQSWEESLSSRRRLRRLYDGSMKRDIGRKRDEAGSCAQTPALCYDVTSV